MPRKLVPAEIEEQICAAWEGGLDDVLEVIEAWLASWDPAELGRRANPTAPALNGRPHNHRGASDVRK